MRRHTSSVGALGLLLLLVATLVPAAGLAGSAGPSQTTTVTLAGWASSPEETAALGRTIAQFERLNRNIDVDYTPISGDYDAAMLARFAAKRPPDVFYVDSLDLFDYQPALEPLNGYIQRTRNWSTRVFYPRLLNGFSVNGRIYGFPKDWSPLGLIANSQMLQRANVTVPRGAPATWAQLTQMMQRLRTSNAVPGGAPACLALDWARILPFVYQNGGAWVNAARTQAVIDSPQNRVTLNTYLGWLRSGLGQTPAQLGVGWCGEAIGKEKAAIVFEGNWIYGLPAEGLPERSLHRQPHGSRQGPRQPRVHGLVLDRQGLAEQEGRVAAASLPRGQAGAVGLGQELRLPAVAQRRDGAHRQGELPA